MARLSNGIFDSYQATGVREDLANFIDSISPEETPFISSIGKTKATQRYHEWQCDSLNPAAANAVTEAEAWSATYIQATTRLGNRVQNFAKQFAIADVQDIVDTAGRAKESAYQLVKAGKEIRRDYEFWQFNHTSSGASGYVGTTSAAPTMQAMSDWVFKVTGNTGYSGTYAVGGLGQLSAVLTGAAIAEATFGLILQDIWDEGGRPDTVFVNGALKRKISDWGTSTSRVWDGSKKITNSVDVYESPFGVLQIKLDRYAASSVGFILDTSKWKMAELVPLRQVDIGRTGLAKPFMLHSAWTLEARNPTGNGAFVSG